MLPILLSIGPIKIYSYGVFLSLGLFLGLYWWWKMGRDEHWDEINLFDGFFLTAFFFAVFGRIGYVILHFEEMGSLYRSLAVLAFPGVSFVSGLVGATAVVWLFGRNHKWEQGKVFDAYVVLLSLVMIFGGIGGLLNGSNPGREVSWGVLYPGEVVKTFPVDLWVIIWAVISFLIVSRVRKNFRFYTWYKGESSMATPGLAALMFVALLGLYSIVLGLVDKSRYLVFGRVPVETIVGVILIALGLALIKRRMGRREGSMWDKLKEKKIAWLQKLRKRRR